MPLTQPCANYKKKQRDGENKGPRFVAPRWFFPRNKRRADASTSCCRNKRINSLRAHTRQQKDTGKLLPRNRKNKILACLPECQKTMEISHRKTAHETCPFRTRTNSKENVPTKTSSHKPGRLQRLAEPHTYKYVPRSAIGVRLSMLVGETTFHEGA